MRVFVVYLVLLEVLLLVYGDSCDKDHPSCKGQSGRSVMTSDPYKVQDPGVIPNVDHDHLSGLDDLDIQYLEVGTNSLTGEVRKVAYVKVDGPRRPSVIYINGYFSTLTIPKSMALYKFCKENGHPFVSFDYEGMELSSGDFEDVTIAMWKEDLLAVIDNLLEGPIILAGASLGGFMSYYAALQRPERTHSILQVAPGFMDEDSAGQFEQLPPEILEDIKAGKTVTIPSPWGTTFKIRMGFFEGLEAFDVSKPLPIKCPIRILHSIEDATVPYTSSIQWGQNVESTDVDIVLRRHGDHRLMKPHDLRVMVNLLRDLIREYPVTEN